MTKIRVIDFFCGAGGFSEGFRQAGFDVKLGVDNWQVAVDTHNENHPNSLAIKDDVLRIAELSDEEFDKIIPDTEVIIGSPPCTDFSNSNKSGNADKSKGIKLLEAYLKIVARKKYKKNSILKYWILENVPKVEKYIKEFYLPEDLGLEGKWKFQVKYKSSGVYNAKYYGVPSNRKRYFCGNFPEPNKEIIKEENLVSLGDILDALGQPKEKLHVEIIDPTYKFKLIGDQVTDHHYYQYLSDFEKKKATRLKQDKGYMGKMSIPENRLKPARTIMATMSFTSRECFVLGNDYSDLRAPTIREIASLMSFPIDYRFYGSSLGTKYRLVGNAVPPKMSFAMAKSILNKFDSSPQLNGYKVIEHAHKLAFHNLNFNEIAIKVEKPKKITSKFKYHIPYFKYETYRVELTNSHSDFDNLKFQWKTEIHYNQGKNRAKVYTPSIQEIGFHQSDLKKADLFFDKRLIRQVVGHNEFQRIYCLTEEQVTKSDLMDPFVLLDKVKFFLNQNFDFGKKGDHLLLKAPPHILPRPIAIGYYILTNYIQLMSSKNE